MKKYMFLLCFVVLFGSCDLLLNNFNICGNQEVSDFLTYFLGSSEKCNEIVEFARDEYNTYKNGGYTFDNSTVSREGIYSRFKDKIPQKPPVTIPANAPVSSTPSEFHFNDSAYGNGTWIAVGTNGSVVRTRDFITYTVEFLTNYTLYGVSYGNGIWVTVGAGGVIFTSKDGTNWKRQYTSVYSDLETVKYGHNVWIATAYGVILKGYRDGETWNAYTMDADHIIDVDYDYPLFISTTSQRRVIKGESGVDWFELRGNTDHTIYSHIEYDNRIIILAEYDEILVSRDDGVSWRSYPSPSGSIIKDIDYVDGKLVLIGGDNTVYLSLDEGRTWKYHILSDVYYSFDTITTDGVDVFLAGVYGSVKNVSISDIIREHEDNSTIGDIEEDDTTIFQNTPDSRWIRRDSTTQFDLNDITYENGLYIAVGDYGTVLVSGDGIVWNQKIVDSNDYLESVASDGNDYIAIGYYGTILSGGRYASNWQVKNYSYGSNAVFFKSISSNGNEFLILDAVSNSLIVSDDGDTWFPVNIPDSLLGAWNSDAWVDMTVFKGNSTLLIAGYTGNILRHWRDKEGKWNSRIVADYDSTNKGFVRSIAYEGDKIIIFTTDNRVHSFTSDLGNHKEYVYLNGAEINSIVRSDDRWVVVGNRGIIYTSTNAGF